MSGTEPTAAEQRRPGETPEGAAAAGEKPSAAAAGVAPTPGREQSSAPATAGGPSAPPFTTEQLVDFRRILEQVVRMTSSGSDLPRSSKPPSQASGDQRHEVPESDPWRSEARPGRKAQGPLAGRAPPPLERNAQQLWRRGIGAEQVAAAQAGHGPEALPAEARGQARRTFQAEVRRRPRLPHPGHAHAHQGQAGATGAPTDTAVNAATACGQVPPARAGARAPGAASS